jgi:hypothetical protein
MSYQVVSGTVSDLQVGSGEYDLSLGSRGETLVGGAAVLASALGAGVNPVADASAEVSMEYFVCKVGDQTVRGMFYKVGFAIGDVIDFVVSADEDGHLIAAAARNPMQRLIWVQPYKTRGNVAQMRHDLLWGSLWSVGPPLAFVVYGFNDFGGSQGGAFILSTVFLSGTAISALINFLARRQFFALSYEATKIFKTLGFSDPENTDLPKVGPKAEKQRAQISGEKQLVDVPWRYRY